MTKRFPLILGLALCAGASFVCAPSATAADESGAAYKTLAEKIGPSLVTVKFVMKLDGPEAERFGEGGRDTEVAGVIIDPSGLVLVSNAKMGGLASRMGMTANPTDIKVLIGDDTEGLKARILARDSDIDLCWLRIDDENAKGKSFGAIDMTTSATPVVGDRLLIVDRLGKFFDHALVVDEARLGGTTKKPRSLLIPAGLGGSPGGGRGDGSLGMPMFTADGKLVGFNVLQIPSKEDSEGGDAMGGGNFAILLLPADEVVKATNRTKDIAAKTDAEKKPEAAPVKAEDKK